MNNQQNQRAVNLHESENESSGDDFTAKRIAGKCIDIKVNSRQLAKQIQSNFRHAAVGYARTAAYAERSEILCRRIKFTDRDVPIMRMIIKRKVLLMSAKKRRQRKTKFRLRERQAVLCNNGIKITD